MSPPRGARRHGAHVLAALAALEAAVALPRAGATMAKAAAAKPLNFTALLNGDAWKRKKEELAKQAEVAKVEKAKAAAEAKAAADEKALMKKIEKEKEAEVKKLQAEEKRRDAALKREAEAEERRRNAPMRPKKTINFTKAFENNSLFNGSLAGRISTAVVKHKPTPPSINFTEIIEEKVNKTTNFFHRVFHRNTPEPTPPPCRYPLPGEKVVYIVQGAMTDDTWDSRLTEKGVKSIEKLRNDPRLARALGHGRQRAQVVVMGPMRKTLETAYRAFGDILPDAKWELNMDVRGDGHEEEPRPELGMTLLGELGASRRVLDEYERKVVAGDHGTSTDRWHRFIDSMRVRSDATHYILVTHNYGCSESGIDIPIGEVRIAALVPDPPEEYGFIAYGGNAWRQLSQPSCWPDVDTPGADPNLTNSNVEAVY